MRPGAGGGKDRQETAVHSGLCTDRRTSRTAPGETVRGKIPDTRGPSGPRWTRRCSAGGFHRRPLTVSRHRPPPLRPSSRLSPPARPQLPWMDQTRACASEGWEGARLLCREGAGCGRVAGLPSKVRGRRGRAKPEGPQGESRTPKSRGTGPPGAGVPASGPLAVLLGSLVLGLSSPPTSESTSQRRGEASNSGQWARRDRPLRDRATSPRGHTRPLAAGTPGRAACSLSENYGRGWQ